MVFSVVLHVIVVFIIFCRYVSSEFICWSCYAIGVCSSHNSIYSANPV